MKDNIDKAIDGLLEGSSSNLKRLQKIIDSGADVYLGQPEDEFKLIVYNTGTKGKSAQDSVITSAAIEALQDYVVNTMEDPEDEAELRLMVNDLNFHDPENWRKLSSKKELKKVLDSITDEGEVFVTDHNGSEVFEVETPTPKAKTSPVTKSTPSIDRSSFDLTTKKGFLDYLKWDGTNYKEVNGKINVEGPVHLSQAPFLTKLPVQFGVVTGYFMCQYNKLTSLQGAPESVGEFFDVKGNKLTSLQGAPQKVGGNFICAGNQLTSLKGSPQEIPAGSFYCNDNQLTSLKGAPKKVHGAFLAWGNPKEFTDEDIAAVSIVGEAKGENMKDVIEQAIDGLVDEGRRVAVQWDDIPYRLQLKIGKLEKQLDDLRFQKASPKVSKRAVEIQAQIDAIENPYTS